MNLDYFSLLRVTFVTELLWLFEEQHLRYYGFFWNGGTRAEYSMSFLSSNI